MSKNMLNRYHPLQVTLHWLIVVLVVTAFVVGKSMSRLPNDDTKLMPLALHMTIGILTLAATLIRLVARMRLPRPAGVSTGNAFLDWLGKAVHALLYLFVFLMAISGISLSMQAGLIPVVYGGSGVSLPSDFYQFTARMLHGFVAPALLILVVVHIGAAVYHQVFLRDNLLSRMWYGKHREEKAAL